MGGFILALGVVSILLTVTGLIASIRGQDPRSWLVIASGDVLALVTAVALGYWLLAAIDGACAVLAVLMWWWQRKNKGRLRAALSGKYRHVRDAMVRTLRERRVSRPALAPTCAG